MVVVCAFEEKQFAVWFLDTFELDPLNKFPACFY